MKMARMVEMYDVDEEVMIRVQVADQVIKDGEIKYELRDPVTNRRFDYLFGADQLTACEKKPTAKKGAKNNEG